MWSVCQSLVSFTYESVDLNARISYDISSSSFRFCWAHIYKTTKKTFMWSSPSLTRRTIRTKPHIPYAVLNIFSLSYFCLHLHCLLLPPSVVAGWLQILQHIRSLSVFCNSSVVFFIVSTLFRQFEFEEKISIFSFIFKTFSSRLRISCMSAVSLFWFPIECLSFMSFFCAQRTLSGHTSQDKKPYMALYECMHVFKS